MRSLKFIIIYLLVSGGIYAQEKVITHYYMDNNEVKLIGRINTKSGLKLSDEKLLGNPKTMTLDKKAKNLVSLVKPVAKYFINKLAELVYDPNKFSKNNQAYCYLLDNYKLPTYDIFKNKILVYSNLSELPKGSSSAGQRFGPNNLLLNFTLEDDHKHFNGYFKGLKLESYQYNYTSVKLKNKHHKINILIDIIVSYFDEYGILRSHNLKTITINNVFPKGKSSKLTNVQKKVVRYIPIVHPIESISISVNEVNTRKKVWDKWLKIYTDNKDKINDFIADKIDEI